jgi:two-component system cell cycle response regulator DivK
MPDRVMVFDDDPDLLKVFQIVLKSKNFDVLGFHQCNNIIEQVKNHSPNVIIMDNWIPDTGGVKAIQQIKKDVLLKSIPVIFCSAHDSIQELAVEAGADFSLKKPFEMDDLEEVISRAISVHAQKPVTELR